MSRQEDYPIHDDASLTTGAGSGFDTGSEFGDFGDAGQRTSGVAGKSKEAADDLMQRGREQATSQLNNQKMRLADGLDGLTQAIRRMSQDLREEQPAIAQYADRGAMQVDHVARYLHEREIFEMIDDVERHARRRPALFIGGAFALGLVAARFLKSSSR